LTPDAAEGVSQDPIGNRHSATGEIFDLGYRTYEGVRLGRWHAVRALAIQSLRTAFGIGRSARAKLAPFGLLLLALIPAVAGSLIAAVSGHAIELFTHQGYFASTAPIFALFCATQSPELVGGDQQYRVLSLYFARALRRSDYVFAKLAALVTALIIIGVTPQIVLFFGRALGHVNPLDRILKDAHIMWPIFASAFLIAILYATLALLIASVTKRRLLATAAIIGVLMLSGVAAEILVRVGGSNMHYAILVSPRQIAEGLTLWLFHVTASPRSLHGRANLPGSVYATAVVAISTISSLLIYWRYRRLQP